MDEVEAIACWVETLHCSNWKENVGPGCWKSNCQMFRSLAYDIRNRDWED